jgi:anti-sigma regulatory factor (Ser/Thr protein kinase)
LAGGQIGRRFQKPVPMRRVLLAAFAETRHYQRLTLRSAADAAIVGQSVAASIHVLSELLDNALAFSSPETTVAVTCVEVKHGVAVEIEDAGVGMSSDAIERANILLATAPTPDVTELKDGAQVGLHVVAELAKREHIEVSLRRSAYGGVLAIVLIPNRLLVTGANIGSDNDGAELHAHAAAMASALAPHDDRHSAAARVMPGSNGRAVGLLNNDAALLRRPDSAKGVPQQPESPITRPVAHSVGAAMPDPHTVARPRLPHRQPQQHLAPELLEDSLTDAGAQESAPARSPEETRNRFARYQRGWTDGKTASHDETITSDDQGRKA